MQLGTSLFHAYAETLRKVYWAEFIESQIQATRIAQFRASLVGEAQAKQPNLLPHLHYHRNRNAPPRTQGGSG